jgi:hypothetical protein
MEGFNRLEQPNGTKLPTGERPLDCPLLNLILCFYPPYLPTNGDLKWIIQYPPLVPFILSSKPNSFKKSKFLSIAERLKPETFESSRIEILLFLWIFFKILILFSVILYTHFSTHFLKSKGLLNVTVNIPTRKVFGRPQEKNNDIWNSTFYFLVNQEHW